MSSFQDVLEEEMTPNSHDNEQQVARKKFSFRVFILIILVFWISIIGVLSWLYISKNKTNEKLKSKLPSKTVLLEEGRAVPVYSGQTLTMPTIKKDKTANNTDAEQTDNSKIVAGKNTGIILPAPTPGLFEKNKQSQLLPIIRKEDGLTVFQAYKKAIKKTDNKPLLSIVLYDVGLSVSKFNSLIENLSESFTIGISPYSNNAKTSTDYARENGHEAWLTLPMETQTYPFDDPGPLTLLSEASLQQNIQRLHIILSSTQGYAGVISQKNHSFTTKEATVSPYIKEIFERGLAIFDSNPYKSSFVKEIAERNGHPHRKNDFWLDDNLSPLAFNQKIRQIIEFGEATGNVVVMMRPYPASIKAMNKFLNSTAAQRFQIVPLSAQMKYE